ncbi:MAG: histidinol-phosphate transaminase [Coriobacteriales bacterium]|nr:histidinol-phosphate transaminase [Coriobacteriales bacterium]
MPLQDVAERVRPALAGFEPYDPAFSPCEVNLSANENTHPLPATVLERFAQACATTPLNRYPDPLANELRDELAAWHGVARESVMVGNGGDELLFNLLFSFGGPGRSLVVAPPCFEEYKNFAKMCQTQVVEVWRDEQSMLPNADALVDAARDAALVMITSPNNPTGDLVDPELVRQLLDQTNALVLVDEAYVEFARNGSSLVPWVADNPRLMVLRTLSKAFALAGLRCGYLVADPQVIDVLAAIRQIYSEDVLAQAVAVQAVRCREELAPIVTDIVAERGWLAQRLAQLPGAVVWPSHANFLLVRLPNAAVVRARLRDEHSVLVRDFSYAPGLADCLRVTVGTRNENDRLMAALEAVVEGGQA